MMFPDTSNDQQRAALRFAAERSRAAGNSRDEFERSPLKPLPPAREESRAGRARELARYAVASSHFHFAGTES
jgi:hypothetical protein